MQHFANFAYDPVTKTGFGSTKNSYGTKGNTELGNLNRQAYEKAKKTGDSTQYTQMQDQQRQAFDGNRVSAATQNAQAATQAKRSAAAEAKRVAGLGIVGKAKNYAGKGFRAIGGVGGLMTASYLAPTLLSMLPQGKQPQPEQEPPY